MISLSDLQTGKLVYHTPATVPVPAPSFAFHLRDSGGTTNGGATNGGTRDRPVRTT